MNKFKFVENMKDGKFHQDIYLNDKKPDGVRSFKYVSCVGEISRILLEIYPSEVEIESDNFKLFTVSDMMDAMANEVGEKVVKESNFVVEGCAKREVKGML